MSPMTGLGETESTRSTRPSAPIQAVARKRLGCAKLTTVLPPSLRALAPPRIAALSTPCGDVHRSWMRWSTASGAGVAAVPATFHAWVPRTNPFARCSPWPIRGNAPPPLGSARARANSSRMAALA